MKALITGITGFSGSWLARTLLGKKHRVFGSVRSTSSYKNVHDIREGLELFLCDVTKKKDVENLVSREEYDVIFHTAAMTFVPECYKDPQKTVRTNILGTLNLLEAARKSGTRARIIIVSSGGVYDTKYKRPVKEHFDVNPVDPYSVSKRAQELFALQYHENYGLDCVIARTFNLIGRGQKESFAASAFARQIRHIKSGRSDPVIKVGNLSAVRDFIDIRDAVEAYCLLYKKGMSGGIYNVCSNEGTMIGEILGMMIDLSGVSVRLESEPDESRVTDRPYQVGCSDKLQKLGFTRKYSIRESLGELLND